MVPITTAVFRVLRIYRYLLLISVFTCQLTLANAQYFALAGHQKKAHIRFRMVRDLIIIPLYINHKGPFNFVLDSGVGLMIITDPKLVDSIDVNTKRTILLYGAGNTISYEAFATSVLDITIPGGIVSKYVSAAIFKKDHFGLSNYTGMPIHGLLGYEFFSQLAVKLNFSDSTLVVGKPGTFKPFKKGVQLPITIEERKPYVKTNITMPDGCPAEHKCIVDLGATHPLSLDNKDFHKESVQKSIVANIGMGLTGPIVGVLTRINEISLGKYSFKNVITSFPDSNIHMNYLVPRDGNLGLGLLKKFNIVLDYSSGKMYLKPNYRFKEPFEHDMSGLEFYAGGDDLKRIIISRVEPGSAGEEAGLNENDEIMAVNLKPVDQLGIMDIDRMFRSKDDRSFIIEYRRKEVFYSTVITLKRRI
jgi:hypothetical protein